MSVQLLRKAGSDPALQALLGSAVALPVGTGAVGVLDSLTGDTNFTNSGEIPLNMLLTLLPALTGSGALGAALAMDPVAREVFGNQFKQGELVHKLSQMKNPPTDVAGQISHLATMKGLGEEAKKATEFPELEKAYVADPNNIKKGVKPEDLMLKRARRGGLAALLGAAGGAVPAVIGMMDSPREAVG